MWVVNVLGVGFPAAIVGTAVWAVVSKRRRAREARELAEPVEYVDGVRTPWPMTSRWSAPGPWNQERGASAVEYGLFVAAVTLAIAAMTVGLGDTVSGMFSGAASAIVCAEHPDECPPASDTTSADTGVNGGASSGSADAGSQPLPGQ